MRLNLPVTNVEYELDASQSIVTTTDLHGNIIYANPYFIEASGFTEEELIGAPQNILRHPDMPPAAFADLWASIKAGLPWRGMVKNRRKNGDYYWVLANVTPVIENGKAVGYMSVRTKPNRDQAEAAAALFKAEKEKPGTLRLRQGTVLHSRWYSRWAEKTSIPLGLRVGAPLAFMIAAAGILGWAIAAPATVAQFDLTYWLMGLAAGGAAAAALLWIFLQKQVVDSLKQAVRVSQLMAGGDLTADIQCYRTDEIGQMMRAIGQLNTNLHSLVGDIRLNFGSMLEATRQIASGNESLSGRTDSQAAALQETAASMEEITAAVKQNADHSAHGDDIAHKALTSAEKGGAIVSNVVSTIADISQSSQKISEIVGIINGIANQTNLLALNAAVEAARAGEAGRGFAVVATEVRDLAQRSATAAMDIRQLIEESVDRVNAATVLARDAGGAMEDILGSIRGVTGIMGDIAAASSEQSNGIDQVTSAVTQLDEVTQQNAAMVEQSTTATHDLKDQGTKLMQALGVFKLKHSEPAARASHAAVKAPRRVVRRAA